MDGKVESFGDGLITGNIGATFPPFDYLARRRISLFRTAILRIHCFLTY
jgi:hypothetical protein